MSPARPLPYACLIALLFCSGCTAIANSFRDDPRHRMSPEKAAALYAEARAAAEAGRHDEAAEALLDLRLVDALDPDLREAAEILLERSTYALVEDLRARGADGVDDLDDLYGEKFPKRLKARIGVSLARAYLEDEERLKCFRQLKRLDEDQPTHTERHEAAELLAEAGFSFAADDGRYFLGLARYRALAPQVLEYLVLNYPTYSRCDDAYATLAQLYADDDEWEYAVARLEDLVLYHPESRHVARAALLIPQYRMNQIVRDDFDRGNLVVALDEIDAWRARYADHELFPESETIRNACLARLAQSDLGIARFYRRIERSTGARLHAERAVEEAAAAGREDLAAEARELWAEVAKMPEEHEPHTPGAGDPVPVDPYEGAPDPELVTPVP